MKTKALVILMLLIFQTFSYGLMVVKAQDEKVIAVYSSDRSADWYDGVWNGTLVDPVRSAWTGGHLTFWSQYSAVKTVLDIYEFEYEEINRTDFENAVNITTLNDKYSVILINSGWAMPLSEEERWAFANYTANGGAIIGYGYGWYNDTDYVNYPPYNQTLWPIFGLEPIPDISPWGDSQSRSDTMLVYSQIYANSSFVNTALSEGIFKNVTFPLTIADFWNQIIVVNTTTAEVIAEFPQYLDYPINPFADAWLPDSDAEVKEHAPAVTINDFGEGKAVFFNWEIHKMIWYYRAGQEKWAEEPSLGCEAILVEILNYLTAGEQTSMWQRLLPAIVVMVGVAGVVIAVISIRTFRRRSPAK